MLVDGFSVRGGSWLDIMNSCFYQVISPLSNGYVLCQDISGEYFALYLPYYFSEDNYES